MQLIFHLISLSLAIYIFFDAKKRMNVLLSLLISVLSYFPIVAILYFSFRKKLPIKLIQTTICSKCGNTCSSTDTHCRKCNNTLVF